MSFKIHGKTHYGWARMSVQAGYVYINATLTGYAYETIPVKSIKAGQTKGKPDDAIVKSSNASLTAPAPEPATLGMLALGAPSLAIWRREEVEGATQKGSGM